MLVNPAMHMAMKGRRTRERFLSWQINILEVVFKAERFPPADVREQLAMELGIAERCVRVWFQNRRQRYRKAFGDSGPSQAQPPAHADCKKEGHSADQTEKTASVSRGADADGELSPATEDDGDRVYKAGADVRGQDSDSGAVTAAAKERAPGAAPASERKGMKLDPMAIVDLAKQHRPASYVLKARDSGDARVGGPQPLGAVAGHGGAVRGACVPQSGCGAGMPMAYAPVAGCGSAMMPGYIYQHGACYQLVNSTDPQANKMTMPAQACDAMPGMMAAMPRHQSMYPPMGMAHPAPMPMAGHHQMHMGQQAPPSNGMYQMPQAAQVYDAHPRGGHTTMYGGSSHMGAAPSGYPYPHGQHAPPPHYQ